MNSKVKILVLVNKLNNCDGISTFVMNYYRNLDLNKIQMDFIITSDKNCDEYINLIKENGGHIYYMKAPKIKTLFKDIKKIKLLMKDLSSKYDVLHSHLINIGYFYLKYARKYKLKFRILHSHNMIDRNKNIIKEFRNIIFNRLTVFNSNKYFACSKPAGEYMFQNKNFDIIKNAINVDKYIFDKNIRNKYREENNIKDSDIVIGMVGSLNYQKNNLFMIDVFRKIVKENKSYKLILVGTGSLLEEIKDKISKYNLENNVLLLGVRNDVHNIMQMFDIFVLPSLFEGLGIVAIEAQASGLPCLLSTPVPKEAKVLSTTKFIDLEQDKWVTNIMNTNILVDRENKKEYISKSGFDIKTEAKKLEKKYIEMSG